jgi:hypothetical protein
MLQKWHWWRILTQVGYIIGFPADTPETIRRDVETLKNELPIDFVKFACLMPLPGSEDHRDMVARGEWIDPDLNKFTGEKPLTLHPNMTTEEWETSLWNSWDQFYDWDHARTLLKRAESSGPNSVRVAVQLFREYLSIQYEHLQPLEGGYMRIRNIRQRRPGLSKANPLLFYPWRFLISLLKYSLAMIKGLRIVILRKWVQSLPSPKNYSDAATGDQE